MFKNENELKYESDPINLKRALESFDGDLNDFH
jgi:hypothetical protein